MTDVERYHGPASDLVEWGQAARSAYELAKGLTVTQFVPDTFRNKPEEAMAAIIAGAEVGLSPMQALQSTFVIGGRPAYYARTMVALTQSHGHEVWTKELTPTKAVVCGRRQGSDNVETVTVTLDQARKAGWTRNKKYDTEPESMLYARAASTVCRRIAADALLGIPYTVEELEAPDAPDVKRTVKRAPKPSAAPPELPVGSEDDAPAPQESNEDEQGEPA